MDNTIKIPVHCMYGLYKRYTLELTPGYTTLIGPTGSGKTTLLRQIRDWAQNKKHIVFIEYSDLHDGRGVASNRYGFRGDTDRLVRSIIASEGQNVIDNFGYFSGTIGRALREAGPKDIILVAIDGIDSGLSIDAAEELKRFIDFMCRDTARNGDRMYLVAAINQYAMLGENNINVRTGTRRTFSSYEAYRSFLLSHKSAREVGDYSDDV